MTDNRTTIRQLEELMSLIENDCAHYEERRDNAFDQTVKDYILTHQRPTKLQKRRCEVTKCSASATEKK